MDVNAKIQQISININRPDERIENWHNDYISKRMGL
jgi:hypothetical protein